LEVGFSGPLFFLGLGEQFSSKYEMLGYKNQGPDAKTPTS
jgi:hypothetical protein